MSFGPRSTTAFPPEHLSTYGNYSAGLRRLATSVPASATYSSANRAFYYPVVLPRPYTLQRFFWQNGATVGTNSLMAGLYSYDETTMQGVVFSGYTLSAGTANHCQYATPAVQAHVVTSSSSTTDGTSFVTGSVTLYARPGYMYALAFVNSKASAANAASTVQTTSAAVSFTSRNSQTYGASTEGRVSLWTAVATSDVTDTITIDFGGGNTQTGAAWVLVCFTNVDTASNDGIVQTAVGSGNSTTPLATLAAFGSANNATFGLNANLADTTTTEGTGFRELADINYATPTNCLQAQFRSDNDTTSDGTITSGQWGALAAEVKSLGTTWTLPAGRYYQAIWCNGTTATVFSTNATPSNAIAGIYNQDSLTTGLPITATVAATVNGVLVNCGFTSRSSP